MAKYKILVIELLLSNNKVAKYGTLVDETAFTRPVGELLKGNYIDGPIHEEAPAPAPSDGAYERAANIYSVIFEEDAPDGMSLEQLNQVIVDKLHEMHMEFHIAKSDIAGEVNSDEAPAQGDVKTEEAGTQAPTIGTVPAAPEVQATEVSVKAQTDEAAASTEAAPEAPEVQSTEAPAATAETSTEANEATDEAQADQPVATLNVGKKKNTGN